MLWSFISVGEKNVVAIATSPEKAFGSLLSRLTSPRWLQINKDIMNTLPSALPFHQSESLTLPTYCAQTQTNMEFNMLLFQNNTNPICILHIYLLIIIRNSFSPPMNTNLQYKRTLETRKHLSNCCVDVGKCHE